MTDTTFETCELDELLEWHPLDEAEDRIQKLLSWVFNYHVLKTDDNRVCCHDQVVFEIQGTKWDMIPEEWNVSIHVKDAWHSYSDIVVCFRLQPDEA
jgi:hypothetical protein